MGRDLFINEAERFQEFTKTLAKYFNDKLVAINYYGEEIHEIHVKPSEFFDIFPDGKPVEFNGKYIRAEKEEKGIKFFTLLTFPRFIERFGVDQLPKNKRRIK